MRDLLITAIIFGSLPFILRNPFVGLLMWVWISVMNPHRLAYGFAFNMPFAQIVAICLFISLVINARKLYSFPLQPASILLVVFVLWIGVSPAFFSFHPEKELELWLTPVKILFMTLIALVLIRNKDELTKVTWVLALSIGFYGVKGGIFTLLTGAEHRIWGPAHSFIEENNALALATIMTIPLFRYLQLQSKNPWVRRGCVSAMAFCLFSALGSHSRGALLALVAMGGFLFLKSRQRGLVVVLVLLLVPLALGMMPEHWWERMGTIKTYEEDQSAMGRVNAWWMAWNLAVDRFPVGGGFAVLEPDVFQRFAPDPLFLQAAHSIYFQVLGEHGFVGLSIFLGVFWFAWRNASWVIHRCRGQAEMEWASDLAAMCQVSLAGYATGGAFLSLTYFDLPYYIVVMLITMRAHIELTFARTLQPTVASP